MKADKLLFLTSRDVRSQLSLDDCIGAVEGAFRLHGESKAAPPAVLGMPAHGGGFHIKAGLLELGRSYFAPKVNGNFPENWLVSFMDYDLGYFDLDTRVLEPLDNPFGPRLLPM
jgi:ornithine cyclodeaminase/alanine dehydrogenase-like protein (mu-crystallin family)